MLYTSRLVVQFGVTFAREHLWSYFAHVGDQHAKLCAPVSYMIEPRYLIPEKSNMSAKLSPMMVERRWPT